MTNPTADDTNHDDLDQYLQGIRDSGIRSLGKVVDVEDRLAQIKRAANEDGERR